MKNTQRWIKTFQFRDMLMKALQEFFDGGEPYKILRAPNDHEFFYTDDEGNAFRIHVSQLIAKGKKK